jgi:hypothetical protein
MAGLIRDKPGMTSLATGSHFIGCFFHRLLFEAASRHLAHALRVRASCLIDIQTSRMG